MSQPVRQTMLEFYRHHQITPVRYNLSDMDAHLERRFSLYAKLGLLPVSFKNSKVLEVAAGTGQNSLYLAQMMPSQLILLEPNETGVEYIRNTYKLFAKPHTSPEIICKTIQEYSPEESFDIVLCENWLGTSRQEISLLKKMSELVAKNGMLALTTVSPIGFVPNLLRRFMAAYVVPMNKGFQERSELLFAAFGSHLDTLSAMTRNKVDWIQDNMINPSYFGVALNIPHLIGQLGGEFDVIGSSPDFSEDWRWFKGLCGNERQFNQHFLAEYWNKAHNFLDYRERPQIGDSDINAELEKKAMHLLNVIEAHENDHINHDDTSFSANKVLSALDDFISLVPRHLLATIQGLCEARSLICDPKLINVSSVANMSSFRGLFAREVTHISLMRVK